MDVEDRIKIFRADLTHGNATDLVRKHITSGECFALSASSYFDLKTRIAVTFGIHPAEIVVVGSAKLGFHWLPTNATDRLVRPQTSTLPFAQVLSLMNVGRMYSTIGRGPSSGLALRISRSICSAVG